MTAPRSGHRPPLTMRAAALTAVRALQEAGHTAYFAGGCVRDMLMGKAPHDIDVATSARPAQVIALFRRTQQVGVQFGVVLVRIGGHVIEVATFRRDADYEDGRHPTHVHFTDAHEDAERRDFTINGMFYDPISREVVDYVGGRDDLCARVIRAIGEPERRFLEDHLRILRAIRFSSRLGFPIERRTWSAMRAQAPAIQRISPERIREELERMLVHPTRARACRDLFRSGVVSHLWSDAAALLPHRRATIALIEALPAVLPFELAFAALLHARSAADADAASAALRCSNQTRKVVSWLVAKQDVLMEPSRVTLADLKLLMVHPAFTSLVILLAAKLRSRGLPTTAHRRVLARVRRIPPEEVAPPPWVNGDDLETLGLPKGPEYKRILERLYYAQLNRDLANAAVARERARCMVEQCIG